MKKNPFPTVFLTALLSWALTAGTLSAQPTGRQGASSYPPVPPSEREVGIAYGLWADRDLWSSTWDKPQIGEYDSRDRRVIRKHAEWLSDAGVDFVWLDWSNNVTYDPCKLWTGGKQDVIEDATAILFDEYRKMSEAGLPHPRISIFIGVTGAPEAAEDGRLQKKADQVWEMYAGNPRYREMMQLHEGKPLLVVYVDTPSPWQNGTPAWDDERFAVRWMTGYVSEQAPLRTDDRVSRYGYWSWEDRGEQTYPVRDGPARVDGHMRGRATARKARRYRLHSGQGSPRRRDAARTVRPGPRRRSPFRHGRLVERMDHRRAAQHRGQQGSGTLAHAGRPLSETAEGGNTPVQNRITRYPNQLPKTILP